MRIEIIATNAIMTEQKRAKPLIGIVAVVNEMVVTAVTLE